MGIVHVVPIGQSELLYDFVSSTTCGNRVQRGPRGYLADGTNVKKMSKTIDTKYILIHFAYAMNTLFEVPMCTPPMTMNATPRKRNSDIIHLGVKTTNDADRRCCLNAVSAENTKARVM